MATAWSGVIPSAWADQTERLMTALLRNCVQDLAQEASRTIPNGGRLPIKTGNLARSIVVDNEPPMIREGDAPAAGFSAGIAAIKPGQTVYIGWTAIYSRRMNYGFVGTDSLGRYYGSAQAVITTGYSNRAGYGFAEAAAAKWPEIVKRQAAAIKGKKV